MTPRNKPSNTTLVLIDGNAIMHRAYHALPPLTNKAGEHTHAVYGFITMLLTIVGKLSPTHLVVCFDRPEPTFRKSMYVGYQAHRPKMDDELSGQFEKVKDVLTAMDIPLYDKAGYEADDVIGTLAHQANSQQKTATTQLDEVIIVTGDRDILQLVNEHVSVYMPVQGLSNGKRYRADDVVKKFGVRPAQIVDYKALAGDPSDNYPGVRGIGPKTACELLQKFETLEGVYQAIADNELVANGISKKVLMALSEYAEDAAMAKKLARIVTDAPVTFDKKKAALHVLGTPESLTKLSELGFTSIVRRLERHAHEDEISRGVRPRKDMSKKNKEPEKDAKEDHAQMSLL